MEVKGKRIGIFGGTFDPVHIGHLVLANRAMEEFNLDTVYFLIAYTPPHKNDRSKGAHDRLEMLKLALADNDRFKVDKREIDAAEVRYTFDSLMEIQEQRREDRILFLMGQDSFISFQSWHRWEDIVKNFDLIVYPRGDRQEELDREILKYEKMGYRVACCKSDPIPVSSGHIRNLSRQGRDLRYLLPDKVYKYIRDHGLYSFGRRADEEFLAAVERIDLSFLNQAFYKNVIDLLEKSLKKHRFDHSISVVKTSLMLAEKYGVDKESAAKAAILHDCAKHNEKKYFDLLLSDGRLKKTDYKAGPMFHSYIGSLFAKYYLNIDDEDILGAIRFHTTGKADMTALQKILFLADGIEPGRDYEGVVSIREMAMENLDRAVLMLMDRTIQYLLEKSIRIDERTIEARNFLIEEGGKI